MPSEHISIEEAATVMAALTTITPERAAALLHTAFAQFVQKPSNIHKEHLMSFPSEDEINDQVNKSLEAEECGSRWPGMTYEQGVRAALDWVLGDEETGPMDIQ